MNSNHMATSEQQQLKMHNNQLCQSKVQSGTQSAGSTAATATAVSIHLPDSSMITNKSTTTTTTTISSMNAIRHPMPSVQSITAACCCPNAISSVPTATASRPCFTSCNDDATTNNTTRDCCSKQRHPSAAASLSIQTMGASFAHAFSFSFSNNNNKDRKQRMISSSSRINCNLLPSTQFVLFAFLIGTVVATLLCGSIAQASPIPAAFNKNNYPSIDLRLLDWPMAQRHQPAKTDADADDDGNNEHISLECYTELDASFVDPDQLYRLNNTGQLSDRACMLRIPTGTRLTVVKMHVHNSKTYVTVLAGSSQVFMPLRTEHIHQDQPSQYGPWHVPCQQAYLVFRSRSHRHLEWVEFRLSPETQDDRDTANASLCHSEGVNHADEELEYGKEENGANGKGNRRLRRK